LYFSGLSSKHKNSQHSLYAAAANSALIFSFENDQSIMDILKSQHLLEDVIGSEKVAQLKSISDSILTIPGINKFFENQSVYISLHPGIDKSINFLYTTQIGAGFTTEELLETLKGGKRLTRTAGGLFNISLNDSTVYYICIKENLLLLSTDSDLVKQGLSESRDQASKFADFIQSNSKIAKNSLAEVYINFETLPSLLKVALPGKLTAELAPLNNQKTYASLVYNFSKEKILLTGTTVPQTAGNYYSIFANIASQKISITNILPDNTANYTAYAIADHLSFRKLLKEWFRGNKDEKRLERTITDINNTYRINLEKTLPNYFKDQFITFQLSTSDRLGAVNLTNGDKLDQLLLELSTQSTEDIKKLKVNDLLYAFFGEAFRNFQTPYYTIVDNYIVFANSSKVLESFLIRYRNNKLLINTSSYSNATEQLPANSNVHMYVDFESSSKIAQKNIYLPFFRHIYSDSGLKKYSSISYQLSSDNKKFLTNLLIVKKQDDVQTDSLSVIK
jgi:hypothetical protein